MSPQEHREAMRKAYESMGVRINSRTLVNNGCNQNEDWAYKAQNKHELRPFVGTELQFYMSGLPAKKSKTKVRKRKMSAKFIKFNDSLINVNEVLKFIVNDPKDVSRKVELELTWQDGDTSEEYYNTLDEATARLEDIYTQLALK